MQTQERARSQKKSQLPLEQRAALTPEEFSLTFGKQKVWAYRLIYGGKIKSIKDYGRTMIPASERERILASAK